MTRAEVSSLIITIAIAAIVVLRLGSLPLLTSARECNSIDVRNNIASLSQLDGCTVVKGYLLIVLMSKRTSVSDYSNITFPELREITDFFILYDVKGLTSFKKLLPNLTVIRGRRLFLNYAMAVSNMPDLATFEFKSLVAIQRGHVFIGSCPKLCFLKTVNWDRLTLAPGENHIIPVRGTTCDITDCTGCESGYCWSNMVCQKFENDNVANLPQTVVPCHSECLGGCYNSTNAGCVVCKSISDHGTCVPECPSNLYYSEHHQRCYTREECGQVYGYVMGKECIGGCPTGYTGSRKLSECIKCASGCVRQCHPPPGYSAFVIFNLADVDIIRGCYRLNGSLYIELRTKIDEKDLVLAFESIREIQGHLQISSSPHLKSLNFLKNLEIIHGQPLDNNTFALTLYKNAKLEELWTPLPGTNVEFVKGGIYSFANYKLCNSVLSKFAQSIVHDKDKDLLQENDQEVLCEPAKLYVEVSSITQNNATVSWAMNQTAEEVEVIYREAKYSKGEQSELDDHICTRINWERELHFTTEIPHNESHYIYNITDLLPNTEYEILVKTFQAKDDYSARSPIQRFTTVMDYPTAPKLSTLKKTANSITLTWNLRNEIKEKVDYYILETIEERVDLEGLDTRDYCKRPRMINRESSIIDYDDCCLRMEQEIEDDLFRQGIEEMFPCRVSSKEGCPDIPANSLKGNITKIDASAQTYIVNDLRHYTLHTFSIYGCNEIGCGTYFLYSERTEFIEVADEITKVEACRIPNTNEYHLVFEEPKNPNGAILSYLVHFQKRQDQESSDLHTSQLSCVTRKQHEINNYRYVTTLNYTFEQTAVRTTSLAGSALSKWFDIGICKPSDFESDDERAPERGIGAMGVFLICIVICAVVAVIWVSIRRGWWRRIDFSAWRRGARRVAGAMRLEDRQILVATFDARATHNTDD